MKPCQCNRYTAGQPYDPSQCRVCWLFANDPAYNQLWGGDGIHEGPGLIQKGINYTQARVQHELAGRSMVSESVLGLRMEACHSCEYFKPISKSCGHSSCGCPIETKARWATQDCPVSRWSHTRPPIRFDHLNLAPPIPGLRFNSSIVADPKGGYVFAFRNGWEGSNVFLTMLDDQFQPSRTWMLQLNHPESSFGREDPRLFWHAGRLHVSFIGVSVNGGSFHTSQMYARLSEEYEVEQVFYPHYEHRNAWEKNWSFFSHDNQLYAVYSISPHRIVRIVGGHALLTHVSPNPIPWKSGEMRGGAPPVLHNGEWYHFFHDSIRGSSGLRQYRSGLYTFQEKPPFTITRYIPNPIMEADHKDNQNNYADVVFVGGAILEGEQWILSHGIHDRWAQIDFFSAASLERQLVK